MKNKIVFIIGKMLQGGPARSFLNLLPLIDYKRNDIFLILFYRGGIIFSEIPSNIIVKYVKPRGLFCLYKENKSSYLLWLPVRIIIKVIGELLIKFFRKPKQIKWKLKEKLLRCDKTEYDLGMAYAEGTSAYYLANKVSAKIKIARIPTDYKSAKLNRDFDRPYYKKMDYLYSITDSNAKILAEIFPELKEKIKVFHLICSQKIIHQRALEGIGFSDDFKGIRIFTMARFDITKGIDLAIGACKILVRKGFTFKWYFIGSGNRSFYNKLIEKHNIINYFIILEPIANPFKMLMQADIYVQPSKYEGKSNAINEAKALNKPIIITRFPTSEEVIDHMKNGIIAPMNDDAIADSIQLLIEKPLLREQFSNYLKENFSGNESEVNKIFELLECQDD